MRLAVLVFLVPLTSPISSWSLLLLLSLLLSLLRFLLFVFVVVAAFVARIVAVRGGNLTKKRSWRGVGGEGAAPPPQCTRRWTDIRLAVLFFLLSLTLSVSLLLIVVLLVGVPVLVVLLLLNVLGS